MLYHFVRIEVYAERMACKHVYLCRTETEAHEVVDEEVVQFVRTNQVFCLLLYIAMLVGWNQLSSGEIGVSMMSSRVVLDCSSTLFSATWLTR